MRILSELLQSNNQSKEIDEMCVLFRIIENTPECPLIFVNKFHIMVFISCSDQNLYDDGDKKNTY